VPPQRPVDARIDAQEPSFSRPQGGAVSDLSRLGRAYQREAARLLDTYPNARAQGQLHSIDYTIVKDLAHTYPMARGRELQQAMVEGSPHLHERKAGHVDDYTRRTVHKAWESLGREPEPWMRAEKDRDGSQGRGVAASALRATFHTGEAGRNAATLFEALLREQGNSEQGRGRDRDDLDGGIADEMKG
jgi:hypothetical protein